MMRSSSLIRKLVRRRVQAVVQKGRFGVESARRSLETSLRELGTDYIDIYLMHEAELADCQPELLAFLREARQQGKIRCFGIGTGFERAEPLCQTMPEFTAVTQFESTIISPNVHKIERESEKLEGGARAIITHGAFEAVSKLRTRMQSDSDFARSAREIVGADCADPRVLSGLILQHAMQANPNGIVLFRSADPRRVATNITAASEPQFTAGQLTQFEALCSQLRASQ
jgi:diketogulonate reductase-like aldo/keto reductase